MPTQNAATIRKLLPTQPLLLMVQHVADLVVRGLRDGLRVKPTNRFWGQWLGELDMRDIAHGSQFLHIAFGVIDAVMFEGFQER